MFVVNIITYNYLNKYSLNISKHVLNPSQEILLFLYPQIIY